MYLYLTWNYMQGEGLGRNEENEKHLNLRKLYSRKKTLTQAQFFAILPKLLVFKMTSTFRHSWFAGSLYCRVDELSYRLCVHTPFGLTDFVKISTYIFLVHHNNSVGKATSSHTQQWLWCTNKKHSVALDFILEQFLHSIYVCSATKTELCLLGALFRECTSVT